MGLRLSETGRPKDAESAYHNALAHWKQLAVDSPIVPAYRQELARSESNLAFFLASVGAAKDAERAYGEALAIQKQRASDFPTVPEVSRRPGPSEAVNRRFPLGPEIPRRSRHMKKHKDFDPLRQRGDFKQLLSEFEAKTKETKK